MRIGLLTGGGDCPGLNAVIAAVVKKGIFHYGDEFIGFLEGWRGVLDNNTIPLTLDSVDGIITKGGTILRTSRTNVRKIEGGLEKCVANIKANHLDALVAIGGDDTQSRDKCSDRARCSGSWGSEDHRQRSERDGCLFRLRYSSEHCNRGDRSVAYNRRSA